MDTLIKIAAEIRSCTKCSLCKNRVQAVPGTGNEKAELVFIGEAPGAKEDAAGKPFIGRAGQLLDKALLEAGYKREDAFITNTVKCRPPKNRDPTAKEKAACRPYLNRQLDLIKPKTIVLLGRHAFMSILPQEAKRLPITKARGKIFTRFGQQYMPTFHPSAALYDPKKYDIIVQDLRQLKKDTKATITMGDF